MSPTLFQGALNFWLKNTRISKIFEEIVSGKRNGFMTIPGIAESPNISEIYCLLTSKLLENYQLLAVTWLCPLNFK